MIRPIVDEIESLSSQLSQVRRELEVHEERKLKLEKLSLGVEDERQSLQQLKAYVSDAKAQIAEFPSDTQILKLERRVESIREQIKQAERTANIHRAGIEAYTQRLESSSRAKSELISGILKVSYELEQMIVPGVREEESSATAEAMISISDVLSSITLYREDDLQQQTTKLEELGQKERELSSLIRQLQSRVDDEMPHIESAKERDEQEILSEFTKEQGCLKNLYDQLLIKNKEQSYHLQRGTHIKREVVENRVETESTLSSRHSHLATEVNRYRSMVTELKEDLAHATRQWCLLKSRAKGQHAEYETAFREKMEKLTEVQERRKKKSEECDALANMKGELYHALRDVRETSRSLSLISARQLSDA